MSFTAPFQRHLESDPFPSWEPPYPTDSSFSFYPDPIRKNTDVCLFPDHGAAFAHGKASLCLGHSEVRLGGIPRPGPVGGGVLFGPAVPRHFRPPPKPETRTSLSHPARPPSARPRRRGRPPSGRREEAASSIVLCGALAQARLQEEAMWSPAIPRPVPDPLERQASLGSGVRPRAGSSSPDEVLGKRGEGAGPTAPQQLQHPSPRPHAGLSNQPGPSYQLTLRQPVPLHLQLESPSHISSPRALTLSKVTKF